MMRREYNKPWTFVGECYVDTNLANELSKQLRLTSADHSEGSKTLKAILNVNRIVAVVDKDKLRDKFYTEHFEVFHRNDYFLILKSIRDQKIAIRFVSTVEKFVLSFAEDYEISLTVFKLPTTLPQLKELTKTRDALKDERLTRFFKDAFLASTIGTELLNNLVELTTERNQ